MTSFGLLSQTLKQTQGFTQACMTTIVLCNYIYQIKLQSSVWPHYHTLKRKGISISMAINIELMHSY